MQQAAQNGSGRREERVPLEAFIELQSEEHLEPLTADGLNVSIGGVAMRAGFVPPLGALLECRFACPPRGDVVCALGEVVWSEWKGTEEGHFGLRFLELDTKSATTLREYLEPEGAYAPAADRLRAASLLIDGLGTAVEAELKLADETRVVLEQQLTFLQLGRGVEVSVLGRGKERGRIASIELRQTHFDVPTLVFGILLDDAPGRSPEAVRPDVAPLFAASAEAPRTIWARETGSAEPVYAVEVREPSAGERSGARAASTDATDELELPTQFAPLRRLGSWCGARWRALWAGGRASAGEPGPEQVDAGQQAARFELPDVRTRALLQLARIRSYTLRSWSLLRRPRARGERLRRPPPLRVQRSTLPGAPPAAPPPPVVEPAAVRRPLRLALAALATLAVALGVYALAPRSGADRMRTPPAVEAEEPLAEELEESEPARPAPGTESNFATTVVESAPDPRIVARHAPAPGSVRAPRLSAPFGEAAVPNGRTFSLRMNGPVETVEGEGRDHGFTVRVPRRLALDRASPIASSHRAVARAMILNRGGYAELTVDFAPGFSPRYQVLGKDNTLEITIERL